MRKERRIAGKRTFRLYGGVRQGSRRRAERRKVKKFYSRYIGGEVEYMTFTSKEEVRSAWDSLKEEEKEYLYKAYEKAKEALREEGSSPRDISALESLEEYVDTCGWDSDGESAFDDFLEIIEN